MNQNARGQHVADVTGGHGVSRAIGHSAQVTSFGYGTLGRNDPPVQALKYCDGTTRFDGVWSFDQKYLGCDMKWGASGGPMLADLDPVTGLGVAFTVNSHLNPPLGGPYYDRLYGPHLTDWVAGMYQSTQSRRLPFVAIAGDWNGDGIDTPGAFRNGTWYLRNANSTGPSEPPFTRGAAGDVPVAGDWDGDGKDGIGYYRNGNWYLANVPGGPVTMSFPYGAADDVPVVGDWDNDGKDDIGVYRPKPPATPTTSRWFLAKLPTRPTSVPLPSWRWFAYGAPADVPVVADWNGDGRDEVGVYRAQAPTSRWYTANVPAASTGVHLPSTRQFLYGLPTEKPVAGDWDGAGGRFGTVTPGVVANETWRLTNGLGGIPTITFRHG